MIGQGLDEGALDRRLLGQQGQVSDVFPKVFQWRHHVSTHRRSTTVYRGTMSRGAPVPSKSHAVAVDADTLLLLEKVGKHSGVLPRALFSTVGSKASCAYLVK